MDDSAQRLLAHLLNHTRIASLGVLFEGAPLVSMVLFAADPTYAAFYIHASRLAQHTRAFLAEPRVSLMVAERDDPQRNPQQLARVAMRGAIVVVAPDDPGFVAGAGVYLRKFPDAGFLFQLGDFALYRFLPESARYVAGFGKTYNLQTHHLTDLAAAHPPA